VRIEQYFLDVASTTKNAMFQNFITGRNHSVTFW
jgi:hypothetical protein